jgi:RNA polymerase sigma factor (sigma-70 family)
MTTQEYEQIACRMRPQLTKLGWSFFHDKDQAEDVVQEALLRLWLLRERVGDVQHAEALLIRLTKNVCVSEWRHKRTRELMSAEKYVGVLSEEIQPMAEDDNKRLLQLAIHSLSPTERRLFRMRHELGMEVSHIAAVTGLLNSSVSSVLSVARRKIVEQLKKGGFL